MTPLPLCCEALFTGAIALEKNSVQLTNRDREILVALTHKVRLLSLEQIARTWWSNSSFGIENARKRLALLSDPAANPYVMQRMKLNAHPELTLNSPIFRWRPGDFTPPFGALSYRLKKRWNQAIKSTTVYIATERGARYFGGFGGKLRRPLQATHDLHVAQIYLQMLQTDPALAALWVSEERFAEERRKEKLPDAVIRDTLGNIILVIEFGGAYDAKHVERVHEDCVARSLPYELW